MGAETGFIRGDTAGAPRIVVTAPAFRLRRVYQTGKRMFWVRACPSPCTPPRRLTVHPTVAAVGAASRKARPAG